MKVDCAFNRGPLSQRGCREVQVNRRSTIRIEAGGGTLIESDNEYPGRSEDIIPSIKGSRRCARNIGRSR